MKDTDTKDRISDAAWQDPELVFGPLKKFGTTLKRLCPFHTEKTPSFVVNVQKQRYHCFGCNLGGDVFDFIQRTRGVEFFEALQILGDAVGIRVDRQYANSRFQKVHQINEAATQFFVAQLDPVSDPYWYLINRNFTEETIAKAKIGYAPDSDKLTRHLRSLGFSEDDIVFAGLARRGDGGRYYEFFRDRIMFPINPNRVKGFSGRVLSADAKPKYLNSPGSEVFQKSNMLYMLNETAVREARMICFVEGNPDVLMAQQDGHLYVVAPLGTAVTQAHLELCRQLKVIPYFIFDSDLAGKKAAKRTADMLIDQRMRGYFNFTPEGKDPADFISAGGNFGKLVRQAIPSSVYLAEFALLNGNGAGKGDPIKLKNIFEDLLAWGDPFVIAEHNAYMKNPVHREIFEELQCRSLIREQTKKSILIYRKEGMQVLKHGRYLLAFYKGAFQMKKGISEDSDFKSLGSSMGDRLLKIKRKAELHEKTRKESKGSTVKDSGNGNGNGKKVQL